MTVVERWSPCRKVNSDPGDDDSRPMPYGRDPELLDQRSGMGEDRALDRRWTATVASRQQLGV